MNRVRPLRSWLLIGGLLVGGTLPCMAKMRSDLVGTMPKIRDAGTPVEANASSTSKNSVRDKELEIVKTDKKLSEEEKRGVDQLQKILVSEQFFRSSDAEINEKAGNSLVEFQLAKKVYRHLVPSTYKNDNQFLQNMYKVRKDPKILWDKLDAELKVDVRNLGQLLSGKPMKGKYKLSDKKRSGKNSNAKMQAAKADKVINAKKKRQPASQSSPKARTLVEKELERLRILRERKAKDQRDQ